MSTQKAILEFDLTDFEARQTFKIACKATDMAMALWDITQRLRDAQKHTDIPATVEDIREAVYGILHERGIDLDDLMT